ncbi:MAG: sulfotransferase [Xenococcaceae cyanobacterium MO_188.B32]|nr:sulfotransferase [Xenococcaceae cyanobacterium MO_188.B32]
MALETFSISEGLKSCGRAFKYEWLKLSAQRQVRILKTRNQLQNYSSSSMAFIVGCGRSGTTILGKIFSSHPQVNYLFEPYHLWAAIDRRTDALNLFYRVDASLLMDSADGDRQTKLYFENLIKSARQNKQAKLTIEKTPLNAMRIGYLEALAPNSKFIHLVRDGVDVCYSIDKLASASTYKIMGKPALNQWWGVNEIKWSILQRDGIAAGYYTEEANILSDNLSKAAYEWLVTLGEIERRKAMLGDRLKEVSYDILLKEPLTTLKNLCEFLEIDWFSSWGNKIISAIDSSLSNPKRTIALPRSMCKAFNLYQQQYQFVNRSVCSDS